MPEVEPDADGEQRRLQGKTVVIDGLVSRPDLNGLVATVGDFHEAKKRYTVHTVGPPRSVLLKPINLVQATEAQEAEDRLATRDALDAECAALARLLDAAPPLAEESAANAPVQAGLDAVGDLAEKNSAALDHVAVAGCPLLAVKEAAIAQALRVLAAPCLAPALEWRTMRGMCMACSNMRPLHVHACASR